MTTAAIERDLVIVACAVSGGIHAALAPQHFREGIGSGGGFVAAALLLGVLAAALTLRPHDTGALTATAVVLAGVIVSYVLATTVGVPALHTEVEPVTGFALATKAVEAGGLLVCLHLLRGGLPAVAFSPKGAMR